MLEIDSLSVAYRNVPALVAVSIRVATGQVVGLIGPNGAGKSTLVKAIGGLVKPSGGSIAFDGQSLMGKAPEDIVRLGIAFVPEGRHIFQTLTVAENLLMGYASGRGRDDASHEAILEQFPVLRSAYHDSAGRLSGGEQQQLAIARAMLARPRLLVLDEPSLGLAPLLVDSVFATLDTLRADGVTILLVEQNAARTIAAADMTYVLRSGRIVAGGTSAELGSRDDVVEAYLGRRA